MLSNTVFSSPGKAIWLAEFLSQLQLPAPEFPMVTKLTADLGALTAWRFVRRASGNLGYFWGGSPDVSVIAIEGCYSFSEAKGLWDGYIGTWRGLRPDPENAWINEQADRILAAYLLIMPHLSAKVIITGHSAGGAVAQVILNKLKTRVGGPQFECVSFGAPRPGNFALTDSLRGQRNIRWMNDNDWIPLLPPRINIWGTAGFYYGPGNIIALQNFSQPSGGVQLTFNGTMSEPMLPTAASVPSSMDLIVQILNLSNRNFTGHSLQEYQERLHRYTILHPSSLPDFVGGGDGEPTDPIPIREAERMVRDAQPVVFAVGEAQNARPVVIPRPALFRAARVGRVWWVYFGEQRIAAAPVRRRAQGMAMAGNNFIRRLQRQAVVDPDALAHQFIEYLQLAADPTSGFVPTLNTTISP